MASWSRYRPGDSGSVGRLHPTAAPSPSDCCAGRCSFAHAISGLATVVRLRKYVFAAIISIAGLVAGMLRVLEVDAFKFLNANRSSAVQLLLARHAEPSRALDAEHHDGDFQSGSTSGRCTQVRDTGRRSRPARDSPRCNHGRHPVVLDCRKSAELEREPHWNAADRPRRPR